MKNNKPISKVLFSLATLAFLALAVGKIQTVKASQEVCPNSSPWIKVDHLDSKTYTYTVPEGKKVVQWCWKASTTVEYGTAGTPSTSTVTVKSTAKNKWGHIQDLSHASFKLEDVNNHQSKKPSMSAEAKCGKIELHFKNPTKFDQWFDYRVDNEAGSNDFWTNYKGTGIIESGIHAGKPYGQIFNLTKVNKYSNKTQTILFDEDSGDHTVEYRLWRGPETDWYLDWKSIQTTSDCEENEEDPEDPTDPEEPQEPTEPEEPETPRGGGSGNQSALSNDNLKCESNNFDVVMDLKRENDAAKDVEVTFTFNGQEKKAKTNDNGRARVTFGRASGTVKATADDFSSQSMSITAPECSEVTPSTHSGTVGQVLGASTLAATGSQDFYQMIMSLTSGILLTSISAYGYNKTKKTV